MHEAVHLNSTAARLKLKEIKGPTTGEIYGLIRTTRRTLPFLDMRNMKGENLSEEPYRHCMAVVSSCL